MKRLGLILSFVAAFQFLAGESRLCCLSFFSSDEFALTQSASDTQPSMQGRCSDCPQPSQAPIGGGCSCPSFMAAETRATISVVKFSTERASDAFSATAPPRAFPSIEANPTSILLSHYPPLKSCATYLRNSTLLI